MRLYGVTGWKNAGKTGLMERLVTEITGRGLSVSTVKHAHHDFEVDRPGKDSFEIRAAGALQVLLASADRWVLQSVREASGQDPDLEEMLARFDPDQIDLILVEGFKYNAFPKLEVHRAILGKPYLYPADPDIRALITDGMAPAGAHPPLLPLGDPEAIADFILEDLAK